MATGAVEWTVEDLEPAQESKLEAALRTLTNELSGQRKELAAMQATMTKLAQRVEQSAATPKKLDQILAKLEGGKALTPEDMDTLRAGAAGVHGALQNAMPRVGIRSHVARA